MNSKDPWKIIDENIMPSVYDSPWTNDETGSFSPYSPDGKIEYFLAKNDVGDWAVAHHIYDHDFSQEPGPHGTAIVKLFSSEGDAREWAKKESQKTQPGDNWKRVQEAMDQTREPGERGYSLNYEIETVKTPEVHREIER
jgi:hypothetical protein